MFSISVGALTSCASGGVDADSTDPSASESATPAPTLDSLEGTQWEGVLDENRLRIELQDDGTVLILEYNGIGPYDAETDVWEQEGDTLTVTLTDLFVDGDEQATLNVTVSGTVGEDSMTLEGEYSGGAAAVMELVPFTVS